jgi:hypothetical protein
MRHRDAWPTASRLERSRRQSVHFCDGKLILEEKRQPTLGSPTTRPALGSIHPRASIRSAGAATTQSRALAMKSEKASS